MTKQPPREFNKIPVPDDLKSCQIPLTNNARTVLTKRYLRRGEDGQPIETEHEMFWRVAYHIARSEAELGGDDAQVETWARKFFDLLINLEFFPNSPTFTGAGTPLGQLAACFVLAIEDDMGRTGSGIFDTLRHAALIQQTGGGNGFSFSRLRPSGAIVKSSNGTATGPLGFLRVYDQAFGEIAQGGSRRGANMAVLRVDHPDIRQFITCKSEEGQIENFNISVGITDKFMHAVIQDAPFDLINPQDGSVWETVPAREIFDLIVEYAHHNGEPGVLFLDAANRTNPVPHLYELEATNPCVTGDTLISTDRGLVRAETLFDEEYDINVAIDGRFGVEDHLTPASRVFMTGTKQVYRLQTKEGYSVRATADHRIMTPQGWVELQNLQPGDAIHIVNRKGGFGTEGTEELGRVLGWLVGDGNINQIRAVLSFFGEEKRELAPAFAGYVSDLVEPLTVPNRHYSVSVTQISDRDEARIQSDRLRIVAEEHGLTDNKHRVPESVFTGTEAMQRGFLQALFTADGGFQDGGAKGGSIRLASSQIELLEDTQKLLLNFGIASKIYRNRREADYRSLPDGHGGSSLFWTQAQHELVISKQNMVVFADEIGFLMDYKQAALNDYVSRGKRGPYAEHFTATVASVTEDGVEEVFDLTEPLTHSFVANGIVVHNCGEQWLGPFENCCLGSVNLAQHYTEDGQVDWQKLEKTIETSVRFLDNVVTANAYVPAIPELREAAERVRRIGLGIMGLGDMMYALGVRYGSETGQEFASQIMEFVRYHAMRTSIKLAKERGPFLAIEGSIYDPADLRWEPPKSLVEYRHNWDRPALDWTKIVKDIKKHGIRNGAQMTVAPTGTIATVTGCEAYGCEPVFALAYMRYVNENAGNSDQQITLQYTSPLFEKALRGAGLDDERINAIVEEVNLKGSCQTVDAVPDDIRETFAVASDITVEEHIRMQAALQAFVDNAISKTVNAPAEATTDDVAEAYLLGWKLGCKGLTVYVTGSRDKVVLETAETKAMKEGTVAEAVVEAPAIEVPYIFNQEKKPRPRLLTGYTYRTPTPAGTTYITINENGHGQGQPFELFMHTEKAGSEIAAVSEAMGRLMSLILRLSSPVSPRNRVKQIERQLRGIGGGRQLGFGPNRVASLPDGVAQVLRDYLLDTERDQSEIAVTPNKQTYESLPRADLEYEDGEYSMKIGDLCPECGQAAYVREEGCRRCYSCGFSEC